MVYRRSTLEGTDDSNCSISWPSWAPVNRYCLSSFLPLVSDARLRSDPAGRVARFCLRKRVFAAGPRSLCHAAVSAMSDPF